MLGLLIALALFLAWCAIGLAALAAMRADVRDLRVVLSAPVIGTALTLLPLFVLSDVGVSMGTAGRPVAAVLLAASAGILIWRRPRLRPAVLPVLALCGVELLLVGRPMFEFGFDWLANANGDMALYILSATQLLRHGLFEPVDFAALAQSRDLATSSQVVTLGGLRPGTQITLAGLSATLDRTPLALYMPMLLALNMCGVCAAGSIAMQAARRWWAATAAAGLLVISPFAGYGVLQQLMPQVWGLAIAVALLSWLMRPEIHGVPGPRPLDLTVIAVLAVSLFVVYPELAASLLVAYGLYVALLLVRRQVALRAVAILWSVPLLAAALVINRFLLHEYHYVSSAIRFGVSAERGGSQLFGYAIVPTALPGAAGLKLFSASPSTPHMDLLIVAAALLFAGLLIVALLAARKGCAAAVVLVSDAVLAAMLARNSNDFGLFKLFMYIQPFVAATVAVWLAGLRGRRPLALGSALITLVVAFQIPTLNAYVDRSRSPVDLRHASQPTLLPTFRRALASTSDPVVTVTDNFVLAMLEGAAAGDQPLHFVSRNVFNLPWRKRSFPIPSPAGPTKAVSFDEAADTSAILARGACTLVLPTGNQLALNRRALPEGPRDLEVTPCSSVENVLVFMTSKVGQPATIPFDRHAVSFWQLEGDTSFPGHTFSGFGRYALFQILNPTPTVRVALELTTSPLAGTPSLYRLPPAAMAGADRVPFPVVGSGSARVISPPLRPAIISGRAYVLLDMGRNGQLPVVPRPGLTDLSGRVGLARPEVSDLLHP